MSSPALRLLLVAALACGAAHAHVFIGPSWPSGDIPLQLRLDATAPNGVAFPLNDGARSWDAVAQSAVNDWNVLNGRSRLVPTIVATVPTTANASDNTTDVFFATTIYGSAFPSRTLAVTLVLPLDYDQDQVRTIEADVVVNLNFVWNSYRGVDRFSPSDLRRVLVHEFGHVLGLGHPDEASPAQNVTAIMNSSGGRVESPQSDDRDGYNVLYATPFARPVVTTQPASRTLDAGGAATLAIAIDGHSPPAAGQFRSNRWWFKAAGATTGEILFTLHQPGTLDFDLAQVADSGSYFFRSVTPDDTVDSAVATLTVNPVSSTPTTALANLSTRGLAGTGSNSMIVGFVVTGNRAKSVLLRAVGPTLGGAPFLVPGVLADPVLTLQDSAAATVATSAEFWDRSANAASIRTTTSRVGAFALALNSRDGVLLVSLPPGSYTATTASSVGARGVVLVEAYDADITRDPASRLANLSTRGFVSNPDNLLIAGFVVNGPGPRTYLIRVAGDTLESFGVTGTLDDPYLKIFRGDGRLARELDDWDSPAASQPALRAAFAQVGAFALADRQEPAMLVTLPPGSYTAHVSGFEDATHRNPSGVALIEIYEMP